MKLKLGRNTFDLESATIDKALRARSERFPDRNFLTHLPDSRRYSYGSIDELTWRFGAGLRNVGLERGAHVAVLMENSPEQLIAIWGAVRAAMVAVPLNSAAKGQLLSYFLNKSECEAIVLEAHLLPRFLEVAASVPAVTRIIVAAACRPGADSDSQPNTSGTGGNSLASFKFSELLDASVAGNEAEHPAHFSDLAMLMFTSGTTGPSKAIMFSQAQLIYWGTDVAIHHEYTQDDTAYVYLPLFHGNALLGSTMGSFMAGASVALTHRFSARAFWGEVKKSGATVFNSVGAVTNFLWARPPSPEDHDHSVQRCHLTPVPKFAAEFEARYGVKIMSAFGLTDYCLGASYNTKSRRDKLGAAGVPRQDVEIRIVDEYDRDMPVGEPGEIIMRNQCPWGASMGYYNAPEATLESRRNLWFHTGDRGFFDEDGYLWYTDRLKDAIRRRGENISAFEVEEVIRSHPSVAEVAVYPVRSELSEDEVGATLVLKEGAVWAPEEIVEHCNRNLAYFMVPRYLDVVHEMPTTLSQKIEKYKLKAQVESDLSRVWDRERGKLTLER